MGQHGQRAGMLPARGRGRWAGTIPWPYLRQLVAILQTSEGQTCQEKAQSLVHPCKQRGAPPCRDVVMHLGLKHVSNSQSAETNGRLVIKA